MESGFLSGGGREHLPSLEFGLPPPPPATACFAWGYSPPPLTKILKETLGVYTGYLPT